MKERLIRTLFMCVLVLVIVTIPVGAADADAAVAIAPPVAWDLVEPATVESVEEPGAEPVQEQLLEETIPEISTEPFSCFTYDDQGHKLNGYWDEETSAWYLFVTSTQKIGDLELYYTGSVTEVSAGVIDAENQCITAAFASNKDQIELVSGDGNSYQIVVMQSGLPSVYLDLEGTTLDEIHADKDAKHKGNSIYIMDPSGTNDLTAEGSVEVKGRGNSTWACYEKKAYQIKFDSKTDVMGMGKAKKWVLLANSSDDSMIRTKLVYDMAETMGMDFVTGQEYVDLWIEGEYRGTYLLGEKVEIGSSRLDLQDNTGALFEHDEAFYKEEDYWVYCDLMGRHFVMKEIVEEEEVYIQAAMEDFKNAVNDFTRYLYSTPTHEITLADLSEMIDVDSFVKYYLINEYTLNRESFATSFYWYKDGPDDVLHLGPIWDFDTCMGNDGVANTESYGDEHIMFRSLLAIPAFYERTQTLLAEYRSTLESMTDNALVLRDYVRASADMNYLRWDVLGKPNPKGGEDFYPTFSEAVEAVYTWLQGREGAFQIAKCTTVTGAVSDDYYEMTLNFQAPENYTNVEFAVWTVNNGQDDLQWFTAQKKAGNIWTYTVDLGMFNASGLYRIDTIAGTERASVASGRCYVDEARGPKYQATATVSENCETLTLKLIDAVPCQNVTFAVWSASDGQNDLRWYNASRNSEGVWEYPVDLKKHNSAGTYYIHAYTDVGNTRTKVATCVADVAYAVYGPEITATVSADCTQMKLVLTHVPKTAGMRVWVPVWSVAGGQDDLQWYELQFTGENTWEYIVDLRGHASAGRYLIHVYAGTNAPQNMVTDGSAEVAFAVQRYVSATVSPDCRRLDIQIQDIGDWETLWIPVWSEVNGQDDIRWYQTEKNPDGTYTYVVNLADHNSAGSYNIHVYSGEENPETLRGDVTVDVKASRQEAISADVSMEKATMTIALSGMEAQESLWVPVWSDENGQDDIQWYRPVKQSDGTWTLTVDLRMHGTKGMYWLHVYNGKNGPEALLADSFAYVASVPNMLTVDVSPDCSTMTISMVDTGKWENLWIPVWSDENGQDDIQWYRPVKAQDGMFTYSVDLVNHHSSGQYNIHVYGGSEGPEELLCYTSTHVAVAQQENFSVKLSQDRMTMTIQVKPTGANTNIWIPVWSNKNGQDDMAWYEPKKQSDGTWTVTVNLKNHDYGGLLHIHVYTGADAPTALFAYKDLVV